MAEELRKSFHEELDQMRAKVVKMSAFVGEAIPRVTDAFLQNDFETTQAIIEGDDVLNAWSVDLDTHCSLLLALQQPMAGDLRSILAVLSINSELERTGDIVCNIARTSQRIYGSTLEPELRGFVTKMSDEALLLIRLATDSFVEQDGSLALSLHDIDDRLDDLNREFFRAILASHTQGNLDFEVAINLALTARHYERIGDHAVNIGERVRYMLDGWTKEQIDASRETGPGGTGETGQTQETDAPEDPAATGDAAE